MKIEEQLKKDFKRVEEAVSRSAKLKLAEALHKLTPYFADHMHSGQNINQSKRSNVAAGKLYSAPNKTNKLYILYGNLVRALIPNQRGNILDTTGSTTTEVVAKFGIDTDVIKYAAIHEFGSGRMRARPYFFPALKDFLKKESNDLLTDIIKHAETAFDK